MAAKREEARLPDFLTVQPQTGVFTSLNLFSYLQKVDANNSTHLIWLLRWGVSEKISVKHLAQTPASSKCYISVDITGCPDRDLAVGSAGA